MSNIQYSKSKVTGTTLVEVMIGSSILVAIITLLTTALSSTFTSYGIVKSTSQIDQTGQYILARLSYVASRHDPSTVAYHTTPSDFQSGAASLPGLQLVTTTADGEMELTNSTSTTSYVSDVISLPSAQTIKSLLASVTRPARTIFGYQVAVRAKQGGVCSPDVAQYEFDPVKNPIIYTGSPVAWYQMDEASWNGTAGEVANASGVSGLNGQAVDGATTSTGKYGNGGSFDGADDYINVGDPSALRILGSLTISAWVKPASTTGIKAIVGRWGNTSPGTSQSYKIAVYNGQFYLDLSPSGNDDNWLRTNTVLSTNTWYHVAGVYTSGSSPSINVYVNGVLDNGVMVGIVPPSLYGGSSSVQLGKDNSITNIFNGQIDDVRIYDYPRTIAQIQSDMSGATPTTGDTDITADLITVPASLSGSTLYSNPGDCVRYKIYFTRPDTTVGTPRILDITIRNG